MKYDIRDESLLDHISRQSSAEQFVVVLCADTLHCAALYHCTFQIFIHFIIRTYEIL